jgi:hypothetical protein
MSLANLHDRVLLGVTAPEGSRLSDSFGCGPRVARCRITTSFADQRVRGPTFAPEDQQRHREGRRATSAWSKAMHSVFFKFVREHNRFIMACQDAVLNTLAVFKNIKYIKNEYK